MSFTKPKEIDDVHAKSELKEWTWNDDSGPFDEIIKKVSIEAATLVIDEINKYAALFITSDMEIQCVLLDGYNIVFDLLEPLAETIRGMGVDSRPMWQEEIDDISEVAQKFESLAKLARELAEKYQGKGTLNQKMGMNCEEWEAAGKPSIHGDPS